MYVLSFLLDYKTRVIIDVIKSIKINNINQSINKFIMEKYQFNPFFSDKSKNEIKNDYNSQDGIYVLKNMAVYRKETKMNKGYMWNSYEYSMTKLGQFTICENVLYSQTFTKEISEDTTLIPRNNKISLDKKINLSKKFTSLDDYLKFRRLEVDGADEDF